jgi:hypothetical protein
MFEATTDRLIIVKPKPPTMAQMKKDLNKILTHPSPPLAQIIKDLNKDLPDAARKK